MFLKASVHHHHRRNMLLEALVLEAHGVPAERAIERSLIEPGFGDWVEAGLAYQYALCNFEFLPAGGAFIKQIFAIFLLLFCDYF